jgi:hypothetical protein
MEKSMIKKIGLIWLPVLVVTVLAASPVLAQAYAETDNERFAIQMVLSNPCADEHVLIEGYFHEVFHMTFPESGGALFRMLLNPQNVVGVGLSTGAKYRFSGTVSDVARFVADNGAQTFTLINQHHFIAKGVSENTVMLETVHVTINADGEVTSALDDVKLKCQ